MAQLSNFPVAVQRLTRMSLILSWQWGSMTKILVSYRAKTGPSKLIEKQTLEADKSDQELIEGVLNGEMECFEVLYEKHHPFVCKVLKRKLPANEDIVAQVTQDTFINVYQSLSGYKGKSGFQSWLRTLATRAVFRYFKTVYKEREHLEFSSRESIVSGLDRFQNQDSKNKLQLEEEAQTARDFVESCLAPLKPVDRMIVQLVYIEDYTMFEAARELELSRANVLVRAHRARKKLRKIFEEQKRQ